MLFIKVFVLLLFILSCDNEENIKIIYVNKKQKIQVMNGKLNCSFRKFEIYEGSKKENKP